MKPLLFVLFITFLTLSSTLQNQFLNWDDMAHVTENAMIRGLDWPHVRDMFAMSVNETYIPLTLLSFAIEYHFFGYNPFVYHLTNLLLHLCVTGLVFVVGLRLGCFPSAAGVAAFLFGIHPMHVESVAWVTARKDVLYSVFYLLAVLSYLGGTDTKFVRKPASRQGGPNSGFSKTNLVSVAVFTLLAMLAKPMALSLPLVLLLLDWFQGRKIDRRAILEKIPYFLIVVPMAWITYSLHMRVPIENWAEAALTWIWTFSFYIQKFFGPVGLSPLYQLPKPVSLMEPPYLTALAIVVGTVALLIRFRRNRWLVFAFFWYFLSIFFLLRFDARADLTIVADRFMYLPSLGLCLLVGIGVTSRHSTFLIKNVECRDVTPILFAPLFLFLTWTSFHQTQIWKDSSTLWGAVIDRHTGVNSQHVSLAAAHNHRAITYREQGLYDLAINHFNKAVEFKSDYAEAYRNRALAYEAKGEFDFAQKDFQTAIEMDESNVKTYNNRGLVYLKVKQYTLALNDFNQAIAIDPKYAESYNNRGVVFITKGEMHSALANFNQAIALDPYFAKAYSNRGNVHFSREEWPQALADYNKALQLDPNNVDSYHNRGALYSILERYNFALADFKKVLELSPGNVDAYNNRATIYSMQGRYDLAEADFEKALSLKPRDSRIYMLRGDHYSRKGDLAAALRDYELILRLEPQNQEVLQKLRTTLNFSEEKLDLSSQQ